MKVYLNLPTAALIPYDVAFSNILNHRTPKYLPTAALIPYDVAFSNILNHRTPKFAYSLRP